ncbi:unnamed protein product [Schistosoma curassoni]|uniref:SHSP domain-containing protein n=1 Tax=Schistosoma curassoni TaxID=6186 RepID=A0A183JVX2_9TREM|nr:unnamed protein product [Schistosoma curassoni]
MSTSQGNHGIQWTGWMQLDGSDFADDLAFQYRTHQQMHIKTASVAAASEAVDLNIHKGKIMILKCNMENINPITLDAETLEDVVFHVPGKHHR